MRSRLQRFAPLAGIAVVQLVLIAILAAKSKGDLRRRDLMMTAAALAAVSAALVALAKFKKERRSLPFRYAPLVAIAVVQVLIMGFAPSTAPQTVSTFDQEAFAESGQIAGLTEIGDVPGVGGITGPGSRIPGVRTTTATGTLAQAGDTSHCVAGRQFDPGIDYYAPPCTPKWTGGNNGGATYQGVTAATIKILDYNSQPNEAVDAIAKAQGAYSTKQEQEAFDRAAATFVTKAYELYGRRIEMEQWDGQCSAVPPDYLCMRNEVRRMIAERKPFFVKWNTSLASPFFDELSALKTPNIGGHNFSDDFAVARAPYHWDVQMSGTRIARHVAQFYCGYLHGKNAIYAGADNPSNDMRNRPRVLGAISQNDPENQRTVAEFKEELKKCGAKVSHEYYYAQDITTAEQQRRAGVAAMREDPESTIIACFCEYIAPNFLYATAEEQKYYPEYLVVGTAFFDADEAAQAYDSTIPPCGAPSRCPQFDNAFGLSTLAEQEPVDKNVAVRVWRAAGNSGTPPYRAAAADWEYFSMMGWLIQSAGPNLNPINMFQGAAASGFRGGTAQDWRQVRRSVGPGDFSWTDDMRIAYWSTQKPSSFNGNPGTFVSVFPRRFLIGEYAKGDLILPPKPR